MNTRRKFLVQGSMAATALLAAKPFNAFSRYSSSLMPLNNNTDKILILHTHHLSSGKFNKTAELVREIRNSNKNIILLDADNCAPSGVHHQASQFGEGLGYEATLPSRNHFQDPDFYSTVPAIVSNYHIEDSRLQAKMQPYKIVQKGNYKIGIIGAVNHPGKAGISYKNPCKAISNLATKLKEEQRCQLVICLSNLDSKNKIDDHTLGRLSKNVDVIIGRNSKKLLQQTSVVLNKNKEEVIINQPGNTENALGQIEICFDKAGKKNKIQFNNFQLKNKTV